jgi:hypothetical protein
LGEQVVPANIAVKPLGHAAPVMMLHSPVPAVLQQACEQGVGVQEDEDGKNRLVPVQLTAIVRVQAMPLLQQEPMAHGFGEHEVPKPAKVVPLGQAMLEYVQVNVVELQQAEALLVQIVAGMQTVPEPDQTLVPVQARWKVSEQEPLVLQQAPMEQGVPEQVLVYPSQTPGRPDAPQPLLDGPGAVMVQASVMRLQQAPTQGLGEQTVPPPRNVD